MRKLDWDYTELAKSYVNRPDYAPAAINAALAIARPDPGVRVLDLGAGAAHLTLALARNELNVLAVEPNAAMREQGQKRTADLENVSWRDAVMEYTGLPAAATSLVTYGSSFGVVDRNDTLNEAARLLRDDGWMLAVFNHRDLDAPLQADIEALIKQALPTYDYGTRREDQSIAINAHPAFGPVHKLECPVTHIVPKEVWIEAWASHNTLKRNAGDAFEPLLGQIAERIHAEPGPTVAVPYMTRGWLAQKIGRTG